ncbi:hypothetical protein DFH94DRAFT_678134 [Russula ochroleuca]|jgi:hypothetical protein|uniref:Uncharacterized protein n=1 Tax=Russula ochroleuca TaxID=152965 RepID=A0A9P5N6A7_9AGAM|nr:hypothetical protein DFH94DRAFT_678134 [Russula ochroleuca]
MKPNFPIDKPSDMKNVLKVARGYFSDNLFFRPRPRHLRDGPDDSLNTEAGSALETWLGPEDDDWWRSKTDGDHPYPELRRNYDPPKTRQLGFEAETARFQEPTTKPEDGGELGEIIRKLGGLSARDTACVVQYCMQRFPELAQQQPAPAQQQPWMQREAYAVTISSEAAAFFGLSTGSTGAPFAPNKTTFSAASSLQKNTSSSSRAAPPSRTDAFTF